MINVFFYLHIGLRKTLDGVEVNMKVSAWLEIMHGTIEEGKLMRTGSSRCTWKMVIKMACICVLRSQNYVLILHCFYLTSLVVLF